jgi:formylglycine-generating enzyme required for sulfatase activity
MRASYLALIVLFITSTSSLLAQDVPQMVLIKGGTFIMGTEDGEGDEKPTRRVTISDFFIGTHEITVEQYRLFANATNINMPKEPKWGWQEDHPIMNLTWHNAVAYIDWLNNKLGENFRLPTEAEFEYVIREGKSGATYSWMSYNTINENIADESYKDETSRNIWDNYNDGFTFTSPVGSLEPNAFGVYDINGNVWEWVSDWYAHYPDQDEVNPQGPENGTHKVGRGASYASDPWHTRIAGRSWVLPEFEGPGLRLARDIKSEENP